MPELPETETIARDLDRDVSGATIHGVEVSRGDVLREIDPRSLKRRLTGRRIQRCWRRAKLIVLELDSGDSIVVQPRFTGALLIDHGQLPQSELQYSTLFFSLSDGRKLHYRDIRRLGTVAVMSAPRFAEYSAGLGVEPLDPTFGAGELSGILRARAQAVKKVLMDQRLIVGIGNIYANEALWRASIDPSRAAGMINTMEAGRLHEALVSVLTESIASRGTSFRDYRDASGARGSFADKLEAYGRGGHPCTRCGNNLVETHAVDGRTTVFCSRCQR